MNNELTAKYSAIQNELAAAPDWKLNTAWWSDRIAELQSIARQLGW